MSEEQPNKRKGYSRTWVLRGSKGPPREWAEIRCERGENCCVLITATVSGNPPATKRYRIDVRGEMSVIE
jgi:hypothetical protein